MWAPGGTQSESREGAREPRERACVSSGHPLFLDSIVIIMITSIIITLVPEHVGHPATHHHYLLHTLWHDHCLGNRPHISFLFPHFVRPTSHLLRWLYKLLFLLNDFLQNGQRTLRPRCWVLLWLSRSHLGGNSLNIFFWQKC